MARQVALLRGVNVGGHNRLPMAELRSLLESLGHTDVRTLLQSGNAVFTSAVGVVDAEAGIEEGLRERLGLRVRVLVRTREELAAVIAADPLAGVAVDGSRYLVVFLSGIPPAAALGALDLEGCAPERLVHLGGRELYHWCPQGLADSRLLGLLDDRRLGVTPTARNWNTVTRLLDLAGG